MKNLIEGEKVDIKSIQTYISQALKPKINSLDQNLKAQQEFDNQQQREIQAINDNLGLASGQRNQNGEINQIQTRDIDSLK